MVGEAKVNEVLELHASPLLLPVALASLLPPPLSGYMLRTARPQQRNLTALIGFDRGSVVTALMPISSAELRR